MDVMAEAARDRAELVELLETLDDADWSTPSLCEDWTVRDVVAHVASYEGVPMKTALVWVTRGRLSFKHMNALALRSTTDATNEELVQRLRDHPRPTGVTAQMGGAIGLVDGMIHQQDVRRPLGRPRHIPAEPLRFALKFAVTSPALLGGWRTRGVRMVADDVDWSTGRGPEASGPGEAVLMALAGRSEALADLHGDGVAKLRTRTNRNA